jgi:hypothetical protein
MAAAAAAGLTFVTSRKENILTSYANVTQLVVDDISFFIGHAQVVHVRSFRPEPIRMAFAQFAMLERSALLSVYLASIVARV